MTAIWLWQSAPTSSTPSRLAAVAVFVRCVSASRDRRKYGSWSACGQCRPVFGQRFLHLAHSARSDRVETYRPASDRWHGKVGLVARERRASLEPLTSDRRPIRSDRIGVSIWLAIDASRSNFREAHASKGRVSSSRNRTWRNRAGRDRRRIAQFVLFLSRDPRCRSPATAVQAPTRFEP